MLACQPLADPQAVSLVLSGSHVTQKRCPLVRGSARVGSGSMCHGRALPFAGRGACSVDGALTGAVSCRLANWSTQRLESPGRARTA